MQSRQLILAEKIEMEFGERELFRFDRLTVYEGEKVGLVGANGAGKTTMLRVLAGELRPTRGHVKMDGDAAFFRQFAVDGKERLADADICELSGKEVSDMRVQDKIWEQSVSGGEETRIRLAQMFSGNKPVAFLDEPTSNLDRKGIAVLKRKLAALDTVVIVSHDRALLNELCTRIIEIEDGKLTEYCGNYDDYMEQKQDAVARQWTEYENYHAEKKRLEKVFQEKKEHARQIEKRPRNMTPREAGLRNFLSQHPKDAKARKMERAAKNVQQRINAMEVKEKPQELPKIRPDFRLTDPPENRYVIRGEGLCFAYEGGPALFQGASFQIANHSRVAIVGDNGAGKTTLLHVENNRKAGIGMKLNNIKWIFFDMGSTLIDETLAMEHRIREVIQGTDVTFEQFVKKKIYYAKQNKPADLETIKFYGLTKTPWHKEDERLYPDTIECLEKIHKSYKVGIIANQSLGSIERLDAFGILKYIDVVVSSAEEGVSKPDRRIFEIALERAGCQPEEAAMVGDRLDNDIVPANVIGMYTIWIKQGNWRDACPREEFEWADMVVKSLSELCKKVV